jgi:hypothetical protein
MLGQRLQVDGHGRNRPSSANARRYRGIRRGSGKNRDRTSMVNVGISNSHVDVGLELGGERCSSLPSAILRRRLRDV